MGICCPNYKKLSVSNLRTMQHYNIGSHNTSMYNWKGLIFRRGISFTINIPYAIVDPIHTSELLLQLTVCGFDEQVVPLKNKSDINSESVWQYDITCIDSQTQKIHISMFSPSTAVVGQYVLAVHVLGKKIGSTEFLLFFNPWCQNDQVYMPSNNDLEEYVLNDSTKIFMGTDDYIVPKDWDLAQFEAGCIEAIILLLNMMPIHQRSDAVDVSRQLSALVNSNDDNGVVMGNWSGKYYDGNSPMSWNGSELILTKYARSMRPVRYGQCWVFSGVLCTTLRTIGIPSRCITNYRSLHDTDGSLKWEIYLDENFNPIRNGGDSCWNFHCWNEAWMKRPDLGTLHDGWQVLDATPQERSNGIFRVGPASVYSVRKGLTSLPYDVGFVFAEVNADKVFFLRQPAGDFKQYMVKKGELGKLVITKKRNSDDVQNITQQYKTHNEDTVSSLCDKEHSAMRASESSITRKIHISIRVTSHIFLTDDLSGTVHVTGLTSRNKTTVKIQALLISYTGRNICKLYEKSEIVSDSEKLVKFHIKHDVLETNIVEEFPFIKIKTFCLDVNSDEMACAEKIISVKTPDLEISHVPKVSKVDRPLACVASILNTLNKTLTHVKLHVKFTDDKPQKIKFRDIMPGEKLVQNLVMIPKSVGLKRLNVSLECRECCGFANTVKFKAIL